MFIEEIPNSPANYPASSVVSGQRDSKVLQVANQGLKADSLSKALRDKKLAVKKDFISKLAVLVTLVALAIILPGVAFHFYGLAVLSASILKMPLLPGLILEALILLGVVGGGISLMKDAKTLHSLNKQESNKKQVSKHTVGEIQETQRNSRLDQLFDLQMQLSQKKIPLEILKEAFDVFQINLPGVENGPSPRLEDNSEIENERLRLRAYLLSQSTFVLGERETFDGEKIENLFKKVNALPVRERKKSQEVYAANQATSLRLKSSSPSLFQDFSRLFRKKKADEQVQL